MPPSLTLEDRITGCLLGGALGDAIGAQYEGRPASDFSIPNDLQVTDDTQLTWATCESIIECGGANPEFVARHFVQWFRARRIVGIGSSTLKALTELSAGGHWALVGAAGERAAGNGAAMRVAPLAFYLDPDVEEERRTLRDICRITHRNEEAYVGALALVRAIRYVMLEGALDRQLLKHLASRLPDSQVRDRIIASVNERPSVEAYARTFGSSGYVVDSVPLALIAAVACDNLLGGIEQLVRCGGDTDTIASMFGQLYGAAYGQASLPIEMVDRIDAAPLLRTVARDLAQFIDRRRP